MECKLYTDLKIQKNLGLKNPCLRRIHGIMNSIQNSYLLARTKQENYWVFWKIGVSYVGILKYILVRRK